MFPISGLETVQDYFPEVVDLWDGFGLSEGILEDEELGGSLVGCKMSGPKGSIKSSETDVPDLLDTLLSPTDSDPLSQVWMETLDLNDLLAYDLSGDVTSDPGLPHQIVQPVQEVQSDANKEFDLFKILLTKTCPPAPTTFSKLQVIMSLPMQIPEAENVDPLGLPLYSDGGSLTDISSDSDAIVLDSSCMKNEDEILDSPLSQEDIDSVLSYSAPSSPSDFLSTVVSPQVDENVEMDTASIDSPVSSVEYKVSEFLSTMVSPHIDEDVETEATSVDSPVSSVEYKVSKSKKSRLEPYSIGNGHSRKEKKKVQNKNAATRYRLKKRAEKESMQSDESVLESKNKELTEKVESLQREISYMKDLMAEIYKAKGLRNKIS